MMKTQIDCDLGHEGIERGIAGEAKNVVRIVWLSAQSMTSTRP